MSIGARTVFQLLTVLSIVGALTLPSDTLGSVSNIGHSQSVIEKALNGMDNAVSGVEANGDPVEFMGLMGSLQADILSQSAASVKDLSTESRLKEMAASAAGKHALRLRQFQKIGKESTPATLGGAASRRFSGLMGEVVTSFKEDLTDARSSAAEQSLVRILIAHHAAVIDMAKIFLIFEEDAILRSVVLDMLAQEQAELKALRKISVTGQDQAVRTL